MFSSVLLSLLLQATLTYELEVSINNGGPWGDWGPFQRCPQGTAVRGFSLKVERPLGDGKDDTALNGIRLFCAVYPSIDPKSTITSTVGNWGDWTPVLWCPRENPVSFALKVEKRQGSGDDTAANNIKIRCSDNTILEGDGGPWGEYGAWSEACILAFCGIRTRVESAQGPGDDTALNDVQFDCCE